MAEDKETKAEASAERERDASILPAAKTKPDPPATDTAASEPPQSKKSFPLMLVVMILMLGVFGISLLLTFGRSPSRAPSNPKMREKFKMMQQQMADFGKLQDQTAPKQKLRQQQQRRDQPEPEPEVEAEAEPDSSDDAEDPPPMCTGAHHGIQEPESGQAHSCGEEAPEESYNEDDKVNEYEVDDDDDDDGEDGDHLEVEADSDLTDYDRMLAAGMMREVVANYPSVFGKRGDISSISGIKIETYSQNQYGGGGATYVSADIKLHNSVGGSSPRSSAREFRVGCVSSMMDDDNRAFLVSLSKFKGQQTATSKHDSDPNSLVLKLQSLNIWNYNLFEERLGMLHSVMEGIDVIGLQEVRSKLKLHGRRRMKAHKQEQDPGNRPPGFDRFQSLAMSTLRPDMEFVYEPAQMFTEQAQGPHHIVHEGVGVMSAYRIVESHALKLTLDRRDPSDYHQRLCLHAVIELPSGFGRLHFLTTHMSLSEKARRTTLKEIADYVDTLEGPVVLTGDFNNPIGPDSGHPLDPSEILGSAGLKDAFHHVERSKDEGMTFPAWKPIKRIDTVYVRDLDITGYSIRGLKAVECDPSWREAGECCAGDIGLFTSDHLIPVAVAELRKKL